MRLTGHLICRGTLTIINKKGHLQMQVTLSLCYKKDTPCKNLVKPFNFHSHKIHEIMKSAFGLNSFFETQPKRPN